MKKKHKKLAKGKLALKVASLLTCVALSSVGFAAWIIVTPVEQTTTGTFVVEKAMNQSLTVNAVWTTGKNTISFTAPKDYDNNGKWLQSDSETDENLTAEVTVTITKDANYTIDNTANFYFVVDYTAYAEAINGATVKTFDDTGAEQSTTATKQFITTPTITTAHSNASQPITATNSVGNTKIYSTVKYSDLEWTNNTTATITYTITFNWGSAFDCATDNHDNENPFTYYNEQSYSKKLAAEAKEYLNVMYGLLTETKTVEGSQQPQTVAKPLTVVLTDIIPTATN